MLVALIAVNVYLVVAFAPDSSLGMLGLVLAKLAQFAAHAAIMWTLARRAFGPIGNGGPGAPFG